jgi:hypothetical protein
MNATLIINALISRERNDDERICIPLTMALIPSPRRGPRVANEKEAGQGKLWPSMKMKTKSLI